MKKSAIPTISYPKTLLLGVQTPEHYTINKESYIEEFHNLAKTNGVINSESLIIKLRSIDPGYFLTKGKREEVQKFCNEHSIEQIVLSEQLTARQASNLAELLHCDIFDRTELILEI